MTTDVCGLFISLSLLKQWIRSQQQQQRNRRWRSDENRKSKHRASSLLPPNPKSERGV